MICFSYGDRQTISLLLRKLKQQAKEKLKSRKPEMVDSLRKLGDFVVDLKWDFTSWIPLVSRMLPSDICKISKRGRQIANQAILSFFAKSCVDLCTSFRFLGDIKCTTYEGAHI